MKYNRSKNIFVDANVVVDYLLHRKHHTKNAESFFEYASQKRFIVLYVSSFTFAIAYHRMQQEEDVPHKIALGLLEKLWHKVRCISVDGAIIQQAMKSGFDDYEDAVQYGCVQRMPGCDVIISRDAKGFELSSIPVMTPRLFLKIF